MLDQWWILCICLCYIYICVCAKVKGVKSIQIYVCVCVFSLCVISALIRPGSLQGGLHLLNISFPGH